MSKSDKTLVRVVRMSSADIVKSAYMIDPSDGCSLVKREAEAGTEIDREYWQRVNQARTYESKMHAK